jgi:DNA-binding beta-propeller fold protein YncE
VTRNELVPRRSLGIVSRLVGAVLVLGLVLAAGASARSTGTAKRCKLVTRIVHHKKHHVLVCRKKRKPSLPPAGSIAATITLPGGATPLAIAATDNAVWVVSGDQRLFRIDPATNSIVATLALPDSEWPEGNVAIGDGAVWVTVASPSTVYQPELDSLLRIDPATNQIVARIHVGHSPEGIAVAPDSVWTANHRAERAPSDADSTGIYDVSRVSLTANAETARSVVETRAKSSDPNAYWCCGPQGMTFAAGSVWTADPQSSGNGLVLRIDPATNAVLARISFDGSKAQACGAMAGNDNAVWVTSGCDNPHVARIDPATNKVTATIDAGGTAGDIALGFGSVWVTALTTLDRIDPATNKLVGRSTIALPTAVATGAGSVWVGTGKSVLRLTPR